MTSLGRRRQYHHGTNQKCPMPAGEAKGDHDLGLNLKVHEQVNSTSTT